MPYAAALMEVGIEGSAFPPGHKQWYLEIVIRVKSGRQNGQTWT
jgi:hypothetical protein